MKVRDILSEADLKLVPKDYERTQTRDEFLDKMANKDEQSIQAGDRVYSQSGDKLYTVKRVTKDGILFKGADRPVNIKVKNSGKKTELGHRVFLIV